MPDEEIYRLIEHGEGERLEFKEEQVTAATLAKAFVAFSNRHGGRVVIGVDKDGHIRGVGDWPALEEKIRNAALNNCRPPLSVQVSRHETADGLVVVVDVPEGTEKPYSANRVYYVRDGLRSRIASRLELVQMLYQSGRFAYDRAPVREASFEDLDLERVEHYIITRRRSPLLVKNGRSPKEFLRAMGLLTEDYVPTLAAVLLFAPYPPRYIPQAGINAFRFRGNKVDNRRILDRETLDGPLDEIIADGMAFVKRNARLVVEMEGLYRREHPEYPLGAVREVLTNAVFHRDYYSPERVIVRIFDDRMEVENPGGLLGVSSVEELLARPRSYPRNGLLFGVGRDMGLVEMVASGIQRIISEVRENGSTTDPVFWADDAHFIVTLPSLWWQRHPSPDLNGS